MNWIVTAIIAVGFLLLLGRFFDRSTLSNLGRLGVVLLGALLVIGFAIYRLVT